MADWQRWVRRGAVLPLALALLVPARLAGAETADPARRGAPRDIKVYDDGPYALVRYSKNGETLERFTGFSRIRDVTLYDDHTVLVAEEEHDRVSAMDLDGNILWTLTARRPQCVEVLAPGRFLVCQDDPPGVVEMDRAGTVFWQITKPLREATGAIRLADGNTAVVEGRNPHAVHVFSPDGRIVWSGTELLAQPRGLALLPSGELVTAGFDTGRAVMFRPYTNEVRAIEYQGHGEDLTVTPQGDLLTFSPEGQLVRLWKEGRRIEWEFSTLYPVYHGVMLPDGTVLASIHRMPDRDCPNATERARVAATPRPSYWRWLLVGLVAAMFVTVVVQWPALRSIVPSAPAVPPHHGENRGEDTHRESPVPLESDIHPRRRVEIGAYLIVAIALAVAAATNLPRTPWQDWSKFWLCVALTLAAGIVLAVLRGRMPAEPDDWRQRMSRVAPMEPPTLRMWILWLAALLLLGVSFYDIEMEIGDAAAGLWMAGIVLLFGGSLQARSRPRQRLTGCVLAAAVLVVAAAPRLYRLADYPPNLHLDMGQWSVQVFELLDTRPETLFTNGWADIPMIGYFWSALWTAIGGRSLAGARLASAVGGIVVVAAAFFIARRLYNLRTAVVSTAFLAVNHGLIHFSRIQAYMDPIPFQVLAISSLLAALETGGYGWFALAGLAGGYSTLTYHAGRITPPVLFLLIVLVLLWYPRTVLRRWPGLVLFIVSLAAMLGPLVIVYYDGRANAFGRGNMYAWVHDGAIDFKILGETLRHGSAMVMGTFWFFRDAASQYAAPGPAFFPPMATLFGMAVVAAVCRPRDLRDTWLLLWCLTILVVGGVLTIDQPFWPRMFAAFVPAALMCAVVVDVLWRGCRVAAGRIGAALATAATVALVALTAWQQLGFYREYCLGLPAGGSTPTMRTEWTQSIMGRDVQRWGRDALIYIVSHNPIDQSCMHPTMSFYDYDVDAHDARLISDYLPFQDPRTIVTYFLPEAADQVDLVRQQYPDAEVSTFNDNLDKPVFTRVVVRQGARRP